MEKTSFFPKPHLNVDEASQYLDLSKSYIYKLSRLKLIPFSKPLGKKLYFFKDELDEWLKTNSVKPAKSSDEE